MGTQIERVLYLKVYAGAVRMVCEYNQLILITSLYFHHLSFPYALHPHYQCVIS